MGGATESSSPNYIGQGYSNRTARGTARGDEPQSMYAVFNGQHHNAFCCFDCKFVSLGLALLSDGLPTVGVLGSWCIQA